MFSQLGFGTQNEINKEIIIISNMSKNVGDIASGGDWTSIPKRLSGAIPDRDRGIQHRQRAVDLA